MYSRFQWHWPIEVSYYTVEKYLKGTQHLCNLSFTGKLMVRSGIDRKQLMSLSHGAYCCVKSSTVIIFGAGVTLSIGSSKSHFAFLKCFRYRIAPVFIQKMYRCIDLILWKKCRWLWKVTAKVMAVRSKVT